MGISTPLGRGPSHYPCSDGTTLRARRALFPPPLPIARRLHYIRIPSIGLECVYAREQSGRNSCSTRSSIVCRKNAFFFFFARHDLSPSRSDRPDLRYFEDSNGPAWKATCAQTILLFSYYYYYYWIDYRIFFLQKFLWNSIGRRSIFHLEITLIPIPV